MVITAFPAVRLPECPVFVPGDIDYAAEVAAFHTNVEHTPEIVVGARSTEDVAMAIAYARGRGMTVAVQGGRHGLGPVTGGILINAGRIDHVVVDPDTHVARIGGGAKWSDVIAAAAPLGLMPVIGSTSDVGAVGYLLGGGVSPIARSHGFSSDYVESFTMVTAAGEVVEATPTARPDLFWALRGGKSGFGIVTEVRFRLVEMSTIYAGVLAFEEAHIKTVFRGWLDWTQTAHFQVTTSTAIMNMPDIDLVPPPFRGKRVLFLRFAFPGDAGLGAELAAPLRALAPVYMDMLGEMPASIRPDSHGPDRPDARLGQWRPAFARRPGVRDPLARSLRRRHQEPVCNGGSSPQRRGCHPRSRQRRRGHRSRCGIHDLPGGILPAALRIDRAACGRGSLPRVRRVDAAGGERQPHGREPAGAAVDRDGDRPALLPSFSSCLAT